MFCSHCGQRTNVKRITFKESWYDFWSRVYGFDGMFPRTLRDLTLRPGLAARKFIEGNRVLYYGPVGYFFLMITLYLVMASILGIDIKDFIVDRQSGFIEQPKSDSGIAQFSRKVMETVADNIRLVAFVVIPFYAFVARYFLFRKSGFNFMEHMVLPLYVMGHIFWINIIGLFVYKFSGSLIFNSIQSLAIILFLGFAYTGLMQHQAKWKAFIKGIFVYVMGQIMWIIFVAIITVIVIVILYYIDPQILEPLKPSRN